MLKSIPVQIKVIIAMKVLWITFFGPWTIPMIDSIAESCHVEVIVPSEGLESYTRREKNGVTFHYLGFRKGHGVYINMDKKIADRYIKIIRKVNPDIIHVHGSEKNLAQIQNFVQNIPVVVSIQGILSGCLPYNTAFIKEKEIRPFRSLKNWFRHQGLYAADRMCERGTKNYEDDILSNTKYFIGRTYWDHARTMFANPQSYYFKGEELLRQEFYHNGGSWCLEKCKRHTVMMPSGYNPLKGMHIAVKAIALLKKIFPDVILTIPAMPMHVIKRTGIKEQLIGEELITYVKYIIKKNNLENNIRFLPKLDGKRMMEEMKLANVFLSCSSIDNSSNAVGEATMLGMPVVVTAVGGLTSFMHDESNCLMSPSGDEYMIAYQIKRFFDNDSLALEMGHNAYKTALQRHDIAKTGKQYIDIYREIIRIHNKLDIHHESVII